MRAAKLAAAADALKRCCGANPPFSLAFLTDQARAPHPLLVARVLPKGAAIILRDYTMLGRAGLAARLKSVCTQRGVKLIIGADPALAARLDADGVHLPSWASPVSVPSGMIVTMACHDRAQLERAGAIGAHLALLSPVFTTKSHPDEGALGADRFRDLAAQSPLPVLALGGVDETNAHQIAGPNIAGIAAIGAFLS